MSVLGHRPHVVTLCGSTKFKQEFLAMTEYFTRKGWIVLSVGFFGHADKIHFSKKEKVELDILHKWKIKMSDSIYIINKGGYIGDSTKSEIEYAQTLGISIAYLEPVK